MRLVCEALQQKQRELQGRLEVSVKSEDLQKAACEALEGHVPSSVPSATPGHAAVQVHAEPLSKRRGEAVQYSRWKGELLMGKVAEFSWQQALSLIR